MLITSSGKSHWIKRSWQMYNFGININFSVLHWLKSKMIRIGFEQFQDLQIRFSGSNTGRDSDESPNLESESILWSSMTFKAKRPKSDWEEGRQEQCYPPLLNLSCKLMNILKQFEEVFVHTRCFSGLVQEMRTVFQEVVRSEECEGFRSFYHGKCRRNLSKFLEFRHIQQSFFCVDPPLESGVPLRLDIWFR
jgi:hypothetical protein